MNKKRIYCLLLCSVLSVALFAQNKAEYFFDNDPGVRRATQVSIDPNAATLNVSTAGLSEGWHILGLRALGSKASHTYTHRFLIMGQTQTTALSDVEYFVDTDPGRDQATPLSFTAGQTAFSFDLTNTDNLSEGVHLLGMRAKYGDRWSQTYTHLFLHTPVQNVPVVVEEVEAYWDNDTENPIVVPFTQQGDTAYINRYNFDMEALAFGPHRLNIHAKVNGVWSILTTYDVCKGAAALFEIENTEDVCVGDEVLVLNATTDMLDGDVYTWDMGDGTTSTEADGVFHTYTQPGRYTISLTVESAGCTSTYSEEIYIHSKSAPAVSLSRSKSSNCAGESVTFTANPSNGGENPVYTWLRNGQTVSGETGAVLTLDDLTNNETIQVKMTTDNKCATTQTAQSEVLTQTVYDLPEIVFSFASTYYKDQSAFQLKNFATPAGGTFYINGTPATLFNPKSNSNPAGEYTVRYVVKNSNGCEAEAETTFTLKAQHDSYTLTVVSADETMGTVTGSGTYTEGTKVTITATAAEGYHFVEWQDGVTDASREVTVTADATYTATFAADEQIDPDPQPEITVTTINLNNATQTSSSNCTVEWTVTNNELNVEYTTPSAWKVVGVEFPLPDDIEEIINISFDYYGCGENIVLYPYLRDSENKRWTMSNYFVNLKLAEWQSVATYLPDKLLWDNADYAYGERPFEKIGFVANPSTESSGSFKVRNIRIEYKTKAHDILSSLGNTDADISIRKIIHDGNVYILRDGKTYTIQGVELR